MEWGSSWFLVLGGARVYDPLRGYGDSGFAGFSVGMTRRLESQRYVWGGRFLVLGGTWFCDPIRGSGDSGCAGFSDGMTRRLESQRYIPGVVRDQNLTSLTLWMITRKIWFADSASRGRLWNCRYSLVATFSLPQCILKTGVIVGCFEVVPNSTINVSDGPNRRPDPGSWPPAR